MLDGLIRLISAGIGFFVWLPAVMWAAEAMTGEPWYSQSITFSDVYPLFVGMAVGFIAFFLFFKVDIVHVLGRKVARLLESDVIGTLANLAFMILLSGMVCGLCGALGTAPHGSYFFAFVYSTYVGIIDMVWLLIVCR